MNHHPAHRRGLTLIEVMFATVIMATMLVASFSAVGSAAKSRIAQKDSGFGLALARQLMSEIMQTRYLDLVNPGFGSESGEARATYDDVDDYDNLEENDARYADGTVIPGGTGWRRTVQVEWVNPTNPAATSNTDQGVKSITITVTSPSKKTTTLKALRSNYDRYEQIPGSQVTYTCWAGVSIQIGTSTSGRNVQGVNLVNMTP